MRSFDQLKKQDRIREIARDKAKARGLIRRSQARLKNQKNKDIIQENAFLILENIYEAIREVIEAGMAAEGYSSEDHVSTIAYAKHSLKLDKVEENKLHKYRKLRNESRYEAKEIKVKEAKEILKFAENLVPKLKQKVESEKI